MAAAVALARSGGDSVAEPGSGAEPPRVVRVAEHVSVAGQVVARRRASKKLFFLDLRPHPAAAAEAGVFLQVLVKESGVGPVTMEWARQGPKQLRPGDVLCCSGVLEYDRQAERQSQGAVLVAQGEGALRVTERFQEANPGGHWAAPLWSANPADQTQGAAAGDGRQPEGGGLFDDSCLAAALSEPAACPPATDTARLCKYWINTRRCGRRGCRFLHPSAAELPAARAAYHAARARKGARKPLQGDAIPPSAKKGKRARAAVFVQWLVDTFGEERLRSGAGVVDVAGGRGELSFELCQVRGIPCTVVDPRLPGCWRLSNRQQRFVRQAEKEGRALMQPAQFAALLTPELWQSATDDAQGQVAGGGGDGGPGTTEGHAEGQRHDPEEAGQDTQGGHESDEGSGDDDEEESDEHERHGNYMGTPAPLSPPDSARLRHTLRHCSVLIAMHPDQATEYVVSCALALGKPWAIVPCCVFARSFPDRRLQMLEPRAAQPTAGELAGREVKGGAEGSDEAAGVVEEEGRPVVLFDDFVEYLRRKPAAECGLPLAERTFLPFFGKNACVYSDATT